MQLIGSLGQMIPNAVNYFTGANATPGLNTATDAEQNASSPDQLLSAIQAAPTPSQPNLIQSLLGLTNNNSPTSATPLIGGLVSMLGGSGSGSAAPSSASSSQAPSLFGLTPGTRALFAANSAPTNTATDASTGAAPGMGTATSPTVASPSSTTGGSIPSMPDFNTFYSNLKNPSFWDKLQEADPKGLLGGVAKMIGGRDITLPDAVNAYLGMQNNATTTQSNQLNLLKNLGILNGMGTSVDPNNVPASYPGANGQPQAQSAPQPQPTAQQMMTAPQGAGPQPSGAPMMAPQGGAPVGVPSTAKGPAMVAPAGADPLASRRAFLMRTAQLQMQYGDTTGALQMMTAARQGLPPGTDVDGSGAVVDAVTRQPVNMGTQQYAAQGAGMISAAQEAPHVAGQEAIDNNQAGNQRTTDAMRIAATAQNNVNTGFDSATGMPTTATSYDIAHGKAPNFMPGQNPWLSEQQADSKDAGSKAADASVMQNEAQQLSAALKGYKFGGPAGQKVLSVLKAIDQVAPLSPQLKDQVGKGELANMDSNSIVSAMAKAATGRVPLGIYNQINKTKPGLLSANPGMAIEALNQDAQRTKDYASFAPTFYRNNPRATAADARSAFEQSHPLAMYQSRVIPDPTPTDGKFQIGHGYQMKDGNVGVFTGTGFQATGVQR